MGTTPPYVKRNLQKPDRLALNRVFVLKWAYDPIINPPVVVVLVINVEQQPTTESKQQSGLPSWTKGQPKNLIQFEMELERTRGELYALSFNNKSSGYNSELRGKIGMIEEIYFMVRLAQEEGEWA